MQAHLGDDFKLRDGEVDLPVKAAQPVPREPKNPLTKEYTVNHIHSIGLPNMIEV